MSKIPNYIAALITLIALVLFHKTEKWEVLTTIIPLGVLITSHIHIYKKEYIEASNLGLIYAYSSLYLTTSYLLFLDNPYSLYTYLLFTVFVLVSLMITKVRKEEKKKIEQEKELIKKVWNQKHKPSVPYYNKEQNDDGTIPYQGGIGFDFEPDE